MSPNDFHTQHPVDQWEVKHYKAQQISPAICVYELHEHDEQQYGSEAEH